MDVTDHIEFDPVDAIGAGAFGDPGARDVRHPGPQGTRCCRSWWRRSRSRCSRPRPSSSSTASPKRTPTSRSSPVGRRLRPGRGATSRSSAPGSSGSATTPNAISCCIELREDAVDERRTAARRSTTAKAGSRAVRHAGAGPRAMVAHGASRDRRGPTEVSALRLPDGSRRAHLPAAGTERHADGRRRAPVPRLELSRRRRRASCCATATSTCSVACRGRRTRRSS